jgi:hypothetical protein
MHADSTQAIRRVLVRVDAVFRGAPELVAFNEPALAGRKSVAARVSVRLNALRS